MKAERARSEQEALFKTLQEEGRITHTAVENKEGPELDSDGEIVQEEDDKAQTQFVPEKGSITNYIPDREHMQLTLEEGLFLADVLDVLDVYDGDSLLPRDQLLETFDSLATGRSAGIAFSDSPFLIRYAAYHHYRSLGWTPRAGIKFGVDLLLYHRGPVFSHAEFAVKLVPTVHVSGQEADAGRSAPWHWLHTISRVNGQAKKTLVLTYIEVDHRTIDLSKTSTMDMLALYRIREASFRRFIPSRSRD
ncbi:radiation sensitive protein rad9 [Savitreella phatthalungensis]